MPFHGAPSILICFNDRREEAFVLQINAKGHCKAGHCQQEISEPEFHRRHHTRIKLGVGNGGMDFKVVLMLRAT
jgi:hypothetical protein